MRRYLEEIIVENFPKMGKETITQVQETQRVPKRINPRHILIKLTKIKHKEQIVVWHHQLNGHEFEQTLGDREGQGSLPCCSP